MDEQIQSDVFDIHVALYKVFLSVKNAYEYDDHASSDHSEADPTSKDEESVYQVYQLSKMFKDDEDEKTYIAAVSGNKVTGFKLSLSSGGEVVERFETLQDAVYSRWFFLYADLAGQYDAWLNM